MYLLYEIINMYIYTCEPFRHNYVYFVSLKIYFLTYLNILSNQPEIYTNLKCIVNIIIFKLILISLLLFTFIIVEMRLLIPKFVDCPFNTHVHLFVCLCLCGICNRPLSCPLHANVLSAHWYYKNINVSRRLYYKHWHRASLNQSKEHV